MIEPGTENSERQFVLLRVARRAVLRPGCLSWPHRRHPPCACTTRAARAAAGNRSQRDHRPDESSRRPRILGITRRPGSPRASHPHSRHPALVAAQALAANRLVDRTGRLGLLPRRVFRGDPPRQARRHQPRRPANPAIRASTEARSPGPGVRPADLILSVSHYNTQQLLGAFSIPEDRVAYVPNGADDLFFEPAPDHERSRVRADLGLPPKVPIPALGRQFSAPQEHPSAHPGRRALARGQGRRARPRADRLRRTRRDHAPA